MISELVQSIPQVLNSDFAGISSLAPATIFLIFFFATFVSEDATCLAAGVLAGQGRISLALAVSACVAGIFIGDILLYWTGKVFGSRVLHLRFVGGLVSRRSITNASEWLERRVASAVFLSRFLPGLRLPTYLAAGVLKTNFGKFALYFFIAAIIWTPILVGSAAYASETLITGSFIVQVVTIFLAVRLIFHFSSWRNRRLFIGRVKRMLNWEFWPIRVFYVPVVLYVLYLGLKHRSLTVFTCVNPAMPAGGFVGESKNDIYVGLARSTDAHQFLLKHTLLRSSESFEGNFDRAKQFICENSLSYPFILKPDAGERGRGVKIVRTESELRHQLSETERDLILQEYFEGVEASIFYVRHPHLNEGSIFSITEKYFPILLGDGRSSIETLILKDRRAVCLARNYFTQNFDRLDIIPASGEEIKIINIGTHSMGAVFRDGDWLYTRALSDQVDRIARSFRGFYFGRFDIRARSFADLQAGENFRVIELNGVTSESTNIYDPKFSLLDAYGILFTQWKLAFEIGFENKRRGAVPTSISAMAKLILSRDSASKAARAINEISTADL